MKTALLSSIMALALTLALCPAGAAPVAAEMPAAPSLLQFTAGGHVVGFAPTQVVLAAFDHALRVEFVGTAGVTPAANANAPASGDGRTAGAPPLGVVTYPNLWRGVSVEYRPSNAGILKSTYTLAPGADAAQIRLRYNVPVEVQSDGSLQFSFGRGIISESAPIAWQEIDGVRVPVAVAFALVADADADASRAARHSSLVTFHIGAYDPRYPLTIDPNYVWHTFYGSSDNDQGRGIAVDESGNVYITGVSGATWGTPLRAHSGGSDIVVVKLDAYGAYQWHTFYGSSNYDEGYGIAVDGSGYVYITGFSGATWGLYPRHPHSGSRDIVVLKLTSAGAYQWHTFYGSSSSDEGYRIAVDGSGNVYVTGYSDATWQGDNNTAPKHAHSGNKDIVVLTLTTIGGMYQWHTFYGSSTFDEGYGIAVDGIGYVYVTGYSDAGWGGPLRLHAGDLDIVVLKLNSAGAYQWHTFYGAFDLDFSWDIAVDGIGNVYVTGYSYDTWQGDGGANPLHPHSGEDDIFVLKLSSAGAYQWHTFYGAGNYIFDEGRGIAVDRGGNAYVTGYSDAAWQGDNSTDPLQPYTGGSDIFALKLGSVSDGVCTATVSGNWSNPVIWNCGHAPNALDNVVIAAGATVTLDKNISRNGNLDVQGTFNPNGKTVTLGAGLAQTIKGNPPGMTFYNLVVDKNFSTDTVTIDGKLQVTRKLTVRKGKLYGASDYEDIEIWGPGQLNLNSNITIGGNLVVTGTLNTNGFGVTFDGGNEQNLTLAVATTFNNLTVVTGTTLIETGSGDYANVQGTLTNHGVIRKTRAIDSATNYYFGLVGQGKLMIGVTTDNFTSITVERRDQNHVGRTGTEGGSGVGWGIYWTITPDGTGEANLTLPHTLGANHADAKVCRFISGTTWDCARTSSDEFTVTRNGVSAFSDWAVGDDVGPTAVGLRSLTAQSTNVAGLLALGFILLVVLFASVCRGSRRLDF